MQGKGSLDGFGGLEVTLHGVQSYCRLIHNPGQDNQQRHICGPNTVGKVALVHRQASLALNEMVGRPGLVPGGVRVTFWQDLRGNQLDCVGFTGLNDVCK